MSSSDHPWRSVRLFAAAAGLCLGLLAGIGNAKAEEPGAGPDVAFKVASLDSFKALPDRGSAEPFALGTSALATGGLVDKWRVVTKALRGEQKILQRCRKNLETCPPAAKRFLAVINKALTREGRARIGEINRAINLNIRPTDDMTLYGVAEKWATPLMTFAAGAGDCEDYAIAKYVALREIGFAAADVRLVVVHDRAEHEDHAMAAVRYDGRWLILDNRTLDMRGDAEATQFDPMFVLDGQSVRRMVAGDAKQPRPLPEKPLPATLPAIGVRALSAGAATPFLL